MSLTNNHDSPTLTSLESKLRSTIRRASSDQFSDLARLVMLTNSTNSTNATNSTQPSPPPELVLPQNVTSTPNETLKSPQHSKGHGRIDKDKPKFLLPNGSSGRSEGRALTDTPIPTAPGSPHM